MTFASGLFRSPTNPSIGRILGRCHRAQTTPYPAASLSRDGLPPQGEEFLELGCQKLGQAALADAGHDLGHLCLALGDLVD